MSNSSPPIDQKKALTSIAPHTFSTFFLPRSIRGKLIVSLIIISGLGIIATMSANYAMWHIEKKVQIIESFFELNQLVLEMRRYEKNYLLYNNKEDLMSTLDYADQVWTSIETVKKFLPNNEIAIQKFYDEELGKYISITKELMNKDLPLQIKDSLEVALRKHGQEITRHVFNMDDKARIQVEREVANYQNISLIILVLAMLLGVILSFYLLRWIMRPLTAIREASSQIMKGKMKSIPVNEAVSYSVEDIELVNSLNLMLQTLNSKQDQLVQSEKLATIGKVTAGIAHEINNPLNNISLTAEVLLEDLPNMVCSERLEMVRDILVQSDRAREVVHHLLKFSKDRKHNSWESVNLVDLVDDSIALVKNQLRISDVHYDFRHPAHPVLINGNLHQLQQVTVNMILNAVQAMPSGGHLLLAVEEKEGKATITISDTGAGIPADLLPRIFDPFFTTKNEGTGLGLSLSYGIIKEHQGEITVESKEGNGATFHIILPKENLKEA